jgi:putative membrane fusion protein
MKRKDTEDKFYETELEEEVDEGKAEERPHPSKKSGSSLKRLTFGSLLILLFMLLYIPSLLNWLSGSTVSSDILRNGILEQAVSVKGVILRNEELVKASPFDGRIITKIAEGEKTPAFSSIATVLNKNSEALLAEMETINAKIVKARMEKAEKTDFFSEDLEKLDGEIGLKVQGLITACNSSSFEDMGQYRREIEQIVEKKAEIIGEGSTDTYVNSLKKQKDSLQKKLGMNTVDVLSDQSGIVSYVIDGLEQALNPDNLETLTPSQLDNLRAEYEKRRESDGMAHAGKPAAKIIKGTEIYIAAVVKTESTQGLKADERIQLRISDKNLETAGTVRFIGKPENGRCIIVIAISRGTDILSAEREVDADIVRQTEEGLKVPVKCLRNFSKDGTKAEIMLIKANVTAKRTVDIVSRDEEYAIIRTPEKELTKTVNLYDTYIVNPDRVIEGEIVQK